MILAAWPRKAAGFADLRRAKPRRDRITGSGGADRIFARGGIDFVDGRGGDADDGDGRDVIDCGPGADLFFADRGDKILGNCEEGGVDV